MPIIQFNTSIEFKRALRNWAKNSQLSVSEYIRTACRYYAEKAVPHIVKMMEE